MLVIAIFSAKMTTNSGQGLPVVVLYMVFTPAGGNLDGFKRLRGFDCKSCRGLTMVGPPV